MTLYCIKCGFGNPYISSKPVKCNSCNQPFISVNTASITQIPTNKPQITQKTRPARLTTVPDPNEIEENYEEYTEIPQNIDLKFDIQAARPNRHSFNDLKGTGNQEQRSPRKQIKGQKGKKNSKVTANQAQKLLQEQFNNLNQQNRAENEGE